MPRSEEYALPNTVNPLESDSTNLQLMVFFNLSKMPGISHAQRLAAGRQAIELIGPSNIFHALLEMQLPLPMEKIEADISAAKDAHKRSIKAQRLFPPGKLPADIWDESMKKIIEVLSALPPNKLIQHYHTMEYIATQEFYPIESSSSAAKLLLTLCKDLSLADEADSLAKNQSLFKAIRQKFSKLHGELLEEKTKKRKFVTAARKFFRLKERGASNKMTA